MERSRRIARRSAAGKPLISRSMANRASMRFTASSAMGEIGVARFPRRAFLAMSASSKNLRRACDTAQGLGQRASDADRRHGGAHSRSRRRPAGCRSSPSDAHLRLLGGAIRRDIVQGCWRSWAAKGTIVAHVGPDAPRHGLALGQDRHGRIVAMQAFGREDVSGDEVVQRPQGVHAGADLASVESGRSMPHGHSAPTAVQRLVLAELVKQDHCQEVRAEEPSWRRMERCRRLADRSQSRQVNFSRTVPLDDLPAARGITSNVSVTSSPSLRSRSESRAQQAQAEGPGTTIRSRGRCSGNGLRPQRGADARRTRPSRSSRRPLGSQFILGERRLGVLELHLQLVEKASRALGPRAVELALQLLDLQRQMGNERLDAGRLHLGMRCVRLRPDRRALCCRQGGLPARQCRLADRASREIGSVRDPRILARRALRCKGFCELSHASGRQVLCGFSSSIPSRRQARSVCVTATTPSLVEGQTKRPRSSLLA